MTKSELRNLYVERRRSIGSEERLRLSGVIAERLFDHLDFRPRHIANCYLSIEDSGEVETRAIFHTLWQAFPRIITTAPRIYPGTNELEAVPYTPETPLIEGPWRIPEPVGDAIDPKAIDVVIVPLICLDLRGHRVGYGKGFYDKFLNRCRPDCLKTGLSFFPPVESIDDVHSGDVALDLCVTPEAVHEFTSP